MTKEQKKAYMLKWRAANVERLRAYEKARPYVKRDRTYKPETLEQKARRRDLARSRYAASPEKFRAKSLAWQKAHPEVPREAARRRKALKAGSPAIEMISRKYIWKRDGGRCHLCGGRADPANFHLDHLVPLSKGGDHTTRNLRVSHPSCNLRRGAGRLPAQLLLIA